MKYIKLAQIAVFVTIAVTIVLYYLFPRTHPFFVNEDSLVEDLAAGLFLLAGLVAMILTSRKSGFQKKGLILVSTTGYVGFLDEIGFGQRIFNFPVPVIADKKIDAVHDLPIAMMKLFLRFAEDNILLAGILTGFGVVLFLFLIYFYRNFIFKNVHTLLKYPPFLLALSSVVLIGFAMVLDTDIFDMEFLIAIEEIFEMNAALVLLLAAINMYIEPYVLD